MRLLLLLFSCLLAVARATSTTVLVTGASGRTGSLVYKLLQSRENVKVQGLVRNVSQAREVLGCTKCDASEGIFEGDVTKPATLKPAFAGVDALAIAVGTGGSNITEEVLKAVEFMGVINSAAALAGNNNGKPTSGKRIVLCSSMGTTDPNPAPFEGGKSLFWKLNAEAFLATSGMKAGVVKPCGLSDGKGATSELLVGHNDAMLSTVMPPMVARADVARVMVAALLETDGGLRFDLCSKASKPPTTDADLHGLIESSRWKF